MSAIALAVFLFILMASAVSVAPIAKRNQNFTPMVRIVLAKEPYHGPPPTYRRQHYAYRYRV